MRHPLPAAPLRLASALAVALAFSLPAAAAADKPATKVPDAKAQAAQDLSDALAALTPARIECKPKTSARLPGKDGKTVDAELTAMDLKGVTYDAKDAAGTQITWFELGAGSTAEDLLKKAVDPKNAGHQVFAARVLCNLKAGLPLAEFHLKQAVALDKDLAAAGTKDTLLDLAVGDYNKNKPAWAWPHLTRATHADKLDELDHFTKTQAAKAGLRFISDKSEHFVFYTDADLRTAQLWAGKLEAAYARLCRTFDLDPHQNVWQGKCAVILCRNHETYAKWMKVVAGDSDMAQKSAGLSISNAAFAGSNSIQFFHDTGNMSYTEGVLYHELTHAFVAQFHGNHPLDCWANEGLAEYVSTNGHGYDQKTQQARERVRKTGSMEDFYTARNIQFFHYGAAFEITTLLLKKNPRGYAHFVKAVTEGADAEEALKANCGMTLDQLTAVYARSLGMGRLKSH